MLYLLLLCGMRLRLRPLDVTQPWSTVQRWVSPPLFHTHTHTKVPLSGALRWLPVRRYLTASPDHVCNGDSNTHSHPKMLKQRLKKETVFRASRRSLSWCRLTRSKQSSVLLRRYVKHQGRSVRPYLLPVRRLHGNPLWRRHLVSVSRSQRERYVGEREKGRGRPGRKAHCILLYSYCTVLLQETVVHFSQILIILFKRSNMLYCC